MPSSTLITPTALVKERHAGREPESPYDWTMQARNTAQRLKLPMEKIVRPEDLEVRTRARKTSSRKKKSGK
jgi:hypothetical protein